MEITALHRRRKSRRRLSVAPASIPAASAEQLSFGLMENLGKGKLLGCGDNANAEPENFSKSSIKTVLLITPLPDDDDDDDNDDDKSFETYFGKSFGSGPNGTVDSMIKDCFFGSSTLLVLGCLDFFGVRDWSLGLLLVFLVAEGGQEKARLREGREL